jgi:general secretion pathway protein K
MAMIDPISGRNQHRGAALIMAILIAALVTITAAAMATRQQLDIRRTGNLVNGDQAWLYSLGMEAWAIQILARDRADNAADHLGEDWATVITPIEVDGGALAGRIADQQGLFNLNGLVQGGKVNNPQLQRYLNLLRTLDLDPGLATALLDWMDRDPDPGIPDGAEDQEYLALTPAYRAANAPLNSPAELAHIKGYTREAVSALLPLVSTLPEATSLNINTAPAAVLLSLSDKMTPADAESLVAARAESEDGFASVGEFLQRDEMAGTGVDPVGLVLASNYFLVESTVQFAGRSQRLYSLLRRDDTGKSVVLARSREVF